MQTYIRLLRNNPDYALLWYAQAVSLIGDWFNTIVLSALVSRYSDGSGLAISGLLLARFLPPLLVSPLAGVLLDRFNRKHLLIFSDLARVVIVLGFLLATSPDRLWLIYLLTVLQFSLSALFEPGRSAITPSLVRREDLVQANVLGSVTWSVMLAIGGASGGLVAAVFGIETALLFDAATFLISALLIMRIRFNRVVIQPHEREGISFRDFVDGLRFAVAHPPTAAALLVKLGGNFGNYDTIMIVYATSLFVLGDQGSGSLGVMWSAFGIGAILGPILINRLNDGSIRVMRRLIIIGYVFVSVGWFLLGGAPILLIAAMATVVKAMGSSIYWTFSSVILQKSVPDEFLGRIFSLDLAGFQLATVISTLVTGFAVESLGAVAVREIVFWTGIISFFPLAVWTLIVRWLEQQEIRQLVSES
jgi:MFS family permease